MLSAIVSMRVPRWLLARIGPLVCAAAVGCTPSSLAVTRIYDGLEVAGPRVAPEAYAAYSEGARLEAAGDLGAARAAYFRALDADDTSAEIWTRFASASCRLGTDPVSAAFTTPLQLAPDYGPVWTEMARCHAKRGHPEEALKSALRGAALSPTDEESTAVVVEIFKQKGDGASAARWMEGWRLAHPGDVTTIVHEPPEAWLPKIDAALGAGDLVRAREHAARARLSAGELALRAAALGRADEARQQADFALRANPADTDAWVARLVAADLKHDEAAFQAGLRLADEEPASRAAIDALGDLLERRVGQEAARTFREASASVTSERP